MSENVRTDLVQELGKVVGINAEILANVVDTQSIMLWWKESVEVDLDFLASRLGALDETVEALVRARKPKSRKLMIVSVLVTGLALGYKIATSNTPPPDDDNRVVYNVTQL